MHAPSFQSKAIGFSPGCLGVFSRTTIGLVGTTNHPGWDLPTIARQ
jgi:hypothetical protein